MGISLAILFALLRLSEAGWWSQSEKAVDRMKALYKEKLLPLEKTYDFEKLTDSPPLKDGDFDAKPIVLIIGEYSTGKTTFIRQLLNADFPQMQIGPEPTTDKFVAIMNNGSRDEAWIPGRVLAADQNSMFHGLNKFGSPVLEKLIGSFLANPVLDSIMLIDTPGVLSGEKQTQRRGYDFEAVVKYFAQKADMILLFFDAHKMDMSDEFQLVIQSMKKYQKKMHIVLNKADTLDSPVELFRVYGALMWSLGKVLNTPEVARVYIGSFWDEKFKTRENLNVFKTSQSELLKQIQMLCGKNHLLQKLDRLLERAHQVLVYARIMSHLRSKMTYFHAKETQKELLSDLTSIFGSIILEYSLSEADFPDVLKIRQKMAHLDLGSYPALQDYTVKELESIASDHGLELRGKILQDVIDGGCDFGRPNEEIFNRDGTCSLGECTG